MPQNERSTLRELLRSLIRSLGVLTKSDASSGGISIAQCHALVEIGRKGKINLNDLADILDLDKSTMSRTINNLVNAGLAVRDLDEHDHRYVVIQLTQSGLSAFESTETDMESYYQSVFDRIPEDKREQVLESLALLTTALGHERHC